MYSALVEAAKKSSLQIVGHVPKEVGLSGVLDAKQRSIEHLDGYETFLESSDSPVKGKTNMFSRLRAWGHMDRDRIPLVVKKIKQAGAWNCVTLVVTQRGYSLSPEEVKKELERPYMKYVPPRLVRQWERMARSVPSPFADAIRFGQAARSELTGALHDASAPILLGTDTGNPWVAAGFSAHQELANLVEAGLTPYEALRAGTRAPAECLDATDEFGSVAVGLRADLLLLNANPLEDVANAAQRVGVMVRGKWLSALELHQMLEKVFAEKQFLKQVARKVTTLQRSNEYDEALELINDSLQSVTREAARNDFLLLKLQVALAANKTDGLTELVGILLENSDSPTAVNRVAWKIYETHAGGQTIDEQVLKRCLNASIVAAQQAEGQSKGIILDTVAHLQHSLGMLDEALATQKRALPHVTGRRRQPLEDFLNKLEKEKSQRQ